MSQISPKSLYSEIVYEISLLNVVYFIKTTLKSMAIACPCGLLISVINLPIIVNRYEALFQVKMARILYGKNLSGSDVEESAALIAQMSVPMSNSNKEVVVGVYGIQVTNNLPAQLSKVIKPSISERVASLVALNVDRSTLELAKAYVAGVVDMILQSQAEMIVLIVQAAKRQNQKCLVKVHKLLARYKSILAGVGQPKGPISLTYFAILSDIRALGDGRTCLAKSVKSEFLHNTALFSPIYASNKPKYHKKLLALAVSVFGGLLVGLLLVPA